LNKTGVLLRLKTLAYRKKFFPTIFTHLPLESNYLIQ